MNRNDLVAGILVGGLSRRMGTSKAVMPFRGRAMAEWAVEAATIVAADIVLLGDLHGAAPALQRFTCIADSAKQAGPIGGLCSLLKYAGERWSLLLACDMPLVDRGLLGRLASALDDAADAVVFRRIDGAAEDHACCGMYHPRVLPILLAELRRGERRLQNILRSVRCKRLMPSNAESQKLANINTPEDFCRLSGSQSHGGSQAGVTGPFQNMGVRQW